jgi:hypothetical protein
MYDEEKQLLSLFAVKCMQYHAKVLHQTKVRRYFILSLVFWLRIVPPYCLANNTTLELNIPLYCLPSHGIMM